MQSYRALTEKPQISIQHFLTIYRMPITLMSIVHMTEALSTLHKPFLHYTN